MPKVIDLSYVDYVRPDECPRLRAFRDRVRSTNEPIAMAGWPPKWMKKVGKQISGGVKQLGKNITGGAKALANNLNQAGKLVETGVKKLGENVTIVGKAAETGIKKLGENIKIVGETVEGGVNRLGINLTEAGKAIEKGVNKLAENIPGTDQFNDVNERRETSAALQPAWTHMNVVMELHRRMTKFLTDFATQKLELAQAPVAPNATAVVTAGMGDAASDALAMQAAQATPAIQGAMQVFNIAKGLLSGKYQAEVQKNVDRVGLGEGGIFAEIYRRANDALARAGGRTPTQDEPAPADYIAAFEAKVRSDKGGSESNDSWYYDYIIALRGELSSLTTEIEKVGAALAVGMQAYNQNQMPQVVQAIGNMVQPLVSNGTLQPAQVQAAIAALHASYQGIALTPDQQALVAQIKPQVAGSSAWKWLAAAAPLLFLL